MIALIAIASSRFISNALEVLSAKNFKAIYFNYGQESLPPNWIFDCFALLENQ